MSSYQLSVYDQYAEYLPKGPVESKKLREYAEDKLRYLIEQQIYEDKSTFYAFTQQINNEILGIPSAEEKRKKQQQQQAQGKERTVTISDPSTSYNIYQQPTSSGMDPYSQPPPLMSNPVPFSVTSDMRVASHNSLEKVKSLRQNLLHNLGTPPSTVSHLPYERSQISREPVSYDELEQEYRRSQLPPSSQFSRTIGRHVSWDSARQPASPNKSKDTILSKGETVLSTKEVDTKIFPPKRVEDSIETLESSEHSENNVSVQDEDEDVGEEEENGDHEEQSITHEELNEANEKPVSPMTLIETSKPLSPSQQNTSTVSETKVDTPSKQDSISFISAPSPEHFPSPLKSVPSPSQAKTTAASPNTIQKSDANDSLRISEESQRSKASSVDVPTRKSKSRTTKSYKEYESSDEDEINLSGSYQSFKESKARNQISPVAKPSQPNNYIPEIHIHNHNHYSAPSSSVPSSSNSNYGSSLPISTNTLPIEFSKPAISNTFIPSGSDENLINNKTYNYQPYSSNTLPFSSYPTNYIPTSSFNAIPDLNSKKRVIVMNGMEPLRDSIDLSNMSLHTMRELRGPY